MQDYKQLLEAAKPTLDIPYQADGPPLGAIFDADVSGGGLLLGGKRKRGVMEGQAVSS